MEANELFIFKQSLLSLGTQGCNNLFIPSTGERPLLEERGGGGGGGGYGGVGGDKNGGRGKNGGGKREIEHATKPQWVGDEFPATKKHHYALFPPCSSSFGPVSKRSLSTPTAGFFPFMTN